MDECIVAIFMVYAGRTFILNVSKFLQPEYMASRPSRLIFIVTSANFRYHML